MPRRCGICLFILLLAGLATPAKAADRFSLVGIHPNSDLGHYFFVQESQTLPQFKWTLGQYTAYDYKLFDVNRKKITVRRGGTTTVDERHAAIENLLYQYYYGSIGLLNRLELMFDIPFFLYYNYGYATADTPTSKYYRLSPGDLRLAAKVNIVDLDKFPLGIAFISAVSFPTGEKGRFLGEDGYTAEENLILEAKPAEWLRIAFNAAFQTRKQVAINDLYFRDCIKLDLGFNYRLSTDASFITEFTSQTTVRDFFASKKTSPTEARVGVRWFPEGKGWFFGGGGSVGILYGGGAPLSSGFINFGYAAGHSREAPTERMEDAAVPPSPAEPPNMPSVAPPVAPPPAMPPPSEGTEPSRYITYTTFFGPGSARINKADVALRQAVEYVAYISGNHKITAMDIRGWTDTAGPRSYNKKLSQRRADAVAIYMKEHLGVLERVNVSTSGMGRDENSPPSRARRVEIIIR
jgi:outer membrane protein OmpA-like peptidoglycan-associated protein